MNIVTIAVHNLAVRCIIGVNAHERRCRQKIYIDVKVDIVNAMSSDNILHTVDYTMLAKAVSSVLQEGEFFTIEYAVGKISSHLQRIVPQALRIWLRIKKPRAILRAKYASCTYEWGKK